MVAKSSILARISIILLSFIFVTAIRERGEGANTHEGAQTDAQTDPNDSNKREDVKRTVDSDNMGKSLVVFFSPLSSFRVSPKNEGTEAS